MGAISSGIPRDVVKRLAEVSRAKTFVETGTFQGATTRWAAELFETVHTIELAPSLYDRYHQDLQQLPNVNPHLGDSAKLLPEIVSQLDSQPVIFWLDGHWSGGETAGESAECPIMEELACLEHRDQDLILIDDARLFLCAPPQPHKPEHWPTMAEICQRYDLERRFIQVIDDVIYIVPNDPAIREVLIAFAQQAGAQHVPQPKHRSLKKAVTKWLQA
ncbi:MAG: class I SAM-dependent methyltransferase [bacterium]|nr:class I SAM-dependent methyltransferase [bacterium]